jgi:membrane protease YdiL (CAAX protease family)
LRWIGLFFLLVFVGGALLAPWVYHCLQWLGAQGGGLGGLGQIPFHRVVNRCILILAVAGLWPLTRALGMTSWSALGLTRTPSAGRQLAGGFALGLLTLGVVAAVVVAGGARRLNWDHTAGRYAAVLAGAAGSAVAVALLEEVLFRGVLFGGLKRDLQWPVALVLSSGIYAWLHFFEKPEPPGAVHWASGLVLLPQMMRGFGDVGRLVPALPCLMVAGLILGVAYHRTGRLWFSLGLHAGWVYWLKLFLFLTGRGTPERQWLGSGRLVDGWVALAVLCLTFWWLNRAGHRAFGKPRA